MGNGTVMTRQPDRGRHVWHANDDAALAASLDRRDRPRRGGQDRRLRLMRPAAPELRELCHDVRQPLATAQALVELLRSGGLDGPRAREQLDWLDRQIDCASALVQHSLNEPPPESVELGPLVLDVVRAAAITSSACLTLDLRADPVVAGDPVLLGRAVRNLIDNACTAAGLAGAVRVTVDVAGGELHLDVEDDGGANQASGPGGHGLGLWIAQSVATRHAGSLGSARSVLGGSLVRLTLPLQQAAP